MKSLILVSLLFALGGVPAFADTATFKTGVGKIFTSDEDFGGCMFGVSPGPADAGLDCKNAFISLDCDGLYGSKGVAAQKYSAVQLAYVTDQNVNVKADDSIKHNGYCVGVRIDNIKY